MFKTTRALVLREVRYKEADRILTLFTESDGKITAKARGALRKSSRTAAATQQLTCAEMTLFFNKGKWTVNEAVLTEAFSGLREDISDFALGCYFAECVEAMGVEDQPDAELMQLALNSFYALSRHLFLPEHIKAAFELRLMCISGYTPQIDTCARCGFSEVSEPWLSLDNGQVCCRGCKDAGMGSMVQLCPASLAAARYIISSPPKRVFSFTLDEQAQKRLSAACEAYLLRQTERRFYTLDYWKSLL